MRIKECSVKLKHNTNINAAVETFLLLLFGCWLFHYFFGHVLFAAHCLSFPTTHSICFWTCFQMEPMAETANTCPTTTIMSGSSTHHHHHHHHGQPSHLSPKSETAPSAGGEAHTNAGSMATSKEDEEDSSNAASSDCKSPGQRYVNLRSCPSERTS